MRLGIIDLGTNSVRFDVHEIQASGQFKNLHREKLMVRLGQGVFIDGRLDESARQRTLQAFLSFRATARELDVQRIVAFGTSALRESVDGAKFISSLRKRTGIDIRIISGEDEARLIALGILKNEPKIQGRCALVDIGGGSTEISVCNGKKVLKSASFELGTARLHQVFLKSSPPKIAKKGEDPPISKLRKYIRQVMEPVLEADDWPKVSRIIGSSGTVRALEKIQKRREGQKRAKPGFSRRELKVWIREMSLMNTTQLLGIPAMEAKRVDMILAGAILLDEIMAVIGAKKVFSTEYSLRDGILEEERRYFRQTRSPRVAIRLEELHRKAKRLGANEAHLKHVVHLSGLLFDKLKNLHRLKSEWRDVLIAAAILHDLGEGINPAGHEQHSYYIIKSTHFASLDDATEDLIAALCLYHAGGKVEPEFIPFWKDTQKRNVFLKLLSLLRVADSLDRGHKGFVDITGVSMDRKTVTLRLLGSSASDLELLRLEQKRDLFEKTFRKNLRATLRKSR
jgi:exopolyphosphatase/guanosine-5'-triphosphate,3'-diphosphate pyrophosphatase